MSDYVPCFLILAFCLFSFIYLSPVPEYWHKKSLPKDRRMIGKMEKFTDTLPLSLIIWSNCGLMFWFPSRREYEEFIRNFLPNFNYFLKEKIKWNGSACIKPQYRRLFSFTKYKWFTSSKIHHSILEPQPMKSYIPCCFNCFRKPKMSQWGNEMMCVYEKMVPKVVLSYIEKTRYTYMLGNLCLRL